VLDLFGSFEALPSSSCIGFGSWWGRFGVLVGDRCGTFIGSCWNSLGFVLEPHWRRFRTVLISYLNLFGALIEFSIFGRPGMLWFRNLQQVH